MEFAYVAINKEALARLIANGQLCAAELSSLDANTKQFLWQTCLWACQKRLGCTVVKGEQKTRLASIETANTQCKSCHQCQREDFAGHPPPVSIHPFKRNTR